MEYEVGTLVRPVERREDWYELADLSHNTDGGISENNLAVVLGVNHFDGYLIGFLDEVVSGHDGFASLDDEAVRENQLYQHHSENDTCWNVLPKEITLAENAD